jgi:hypothetical protein
MLSHRNSLIKGGWNIKDFNRVALAVTRFSY